MKGIGYVLTGETPALTGPKTIAVVTCPATCAMRLHDTYVTSPVGAADRMLLAWQRVDTPSGTITATGTLDELEQHTLAPASGIVTLLDVLTNDHTYLAGKVGERDVDIIDGYTWEPAFGGGLWLGPSKSAGLILLKAITSAVLNIETHVELFGGA